MAHDTTVATTIPLVVIAGPTASGKTALAIDLAKKYKGEIICADSRTIYKDMDIGTAKPTKDEQGDVPHWGLDIATPGELFTAADFKRYAYKKIAEIRARGHVPFLVGGTGLYIDAVVFDYQFGPKANIELRLKLENLSLDELYKYCKKNNVKLPENSKNKRYVVRAIEQNDDTSQRTQTPISTSIIVGITTERDVLRERIAARIEQLLANGVVEEAILLGKKYGWDNEAMTGNIYPLIRDYVEEKISLDQLRERAVIQDWRLAKRQLTWLRRNPYVQWHTLTEARDYLSRLLANA